MEARRLGATRLLLAAVPGFWGASGHNRSVDPPAPTVDRHLVMKAIVQDQYGSPDVLELRDVAKPVVGEDEALVRVRAASANPADWHYMRGVPYIMRPQAGLRKPKNGILGRDIAGEVAAVGENMTRFRPGDQVFAEVDGSL